MSKISKIYKHEFMSLSIRILIYTQGEYNPCFVFDTFPIISKAILPLVLMKFCYL